MQNCIISHYLHVSFFISFVDERLIIVLFPGHALLAKEHVLQKKIFYCLHGIHVHIKIIYNNSFTFKIYEPLLGLTNFQILNVKVIIIQICKFYCCQNGIKTIFKISEKFIVKALTLRVKISFVLQC